MKITVYTAFHFKRANQQCKGYIKSGVNKAGKQWSIKVLVIINLLLLTSTCSFNEI